MIAIYCQLNLHPHQQAAIEHLAHDPYGRDIVHVPTGGGKTIIFMQVVHDFLLDGKRSLILVHREHLIRQVIERFEQFYPDDQIGIVRGTERDWDAPIVIASVLTAVRDVQTMPRDFQLVVTDECHRCIAPSHFSIYQALGLINEDLFSEIVLQAISERAKAKEAQALIDDFDKSVEEDSALYHDRREQVIDKAQVLTSQNEISAKQRDAIIRLREATKNIESDRRPRKHIGFTATPQRTDKLGLGAVFNGVPYQCHFDELVEQKLLCDLDVMPIQLFDEDDELLSRASLRAVLRGGDVDAQAVQLYKDHASDRICTIAFCMSIDHAEHLATTFRDSGIEAQPVHSLMSDEARSQNERRFRAGDLPVLTNVNVFVEGFDVPRLDCILMLRDSDSATLIPQSLGRGARIAPGKDSCLVIDMGATIDTNELSKAVDMLRVIQPTSLIESADRENENENEKQPTPMPIAIGLEIGEIFKIGEHIGGYDREWAWIPAIPIRGLALDLGYEKFLKIGQQQDGLYAASYDEGRHRTLICRDLTSIHDCKNACLRYLLDNDIRYWFARRDAAWRTQPATAKQVWKLNSFNIEVPADCDKGTAHDLIAAYYINREVIDTTNKETTNV